MRKLIICILFCLILMPFQATFAAERYQWLHSTDTIGFFFDTQTLKFGSTGDGKTNYSILDVWIKDVYNSEGVNDRIKYREKYSLTVEGWENLDYELHHYQFNTKTKQIRSIGYAAYSKKGIVLESTDYKGDWNDIFPDSYGEFWLNEIHLYSLTNRTVIENRSKY